MGLDLVDDHAYVTNSFEGLHVIDVSTPSAPVEVGSLETLGDAYNVDVQDGFDSGDTAAWSSVVESTL